MTEKETPVVDYVEQRSTGSPAGRREADKHKCGMCDFMADKNATCFEVIKRTMRDEHKKNDHRFELLDAKLGTYMTKWAMGIIVSVATVSLMGLSGIGLWLVERNHNELLKIPGSISSMALEVTEIKVKQVGVLKTLEDIAPEHKELMEHLNRDQ